MSYIVRYLNGNGEFLLGINDLYEKDIYLPFELFHPSGVLLISYDKKLKIK